MYAIKWVMHRYETQPVVVENSAVADLDALVLSCQWRLSEMREKYPLNQPDGFLVFDEAGNELRRWFGSERPHLRR
jgi:hypothetical protein